MSSKKNPNANHGFVTPEWIRERITQAALRLTGSCVALDPATTDDNPMQAMLYLTPSTDPDGLQARWTYTIPHGGFIYVNPPYLQPWYEKIEEEAAQINRISAFHLAALIPARPGTGYFTALRKKAAITVFIKGRLSFIDPATGEPVLGKNGKPQPAGFDSALLYFGDRPHAFASYFEDVGWTA